MGTPEVKKLWRADLLDRGLGWIPQDLALLDLSHNLAGN